MFKKLKEKLSGWAKKVADNSEEEVLEESIEEKSESDALQPQESGSLKEKIEKLEKTVEEARKEIIEVESKEKGSLKPKTPEISHKTPSPTPTKEIPIPQKFDNALQGFKPDTEAIQEIHKEIKKKPDSPPSVEVPSPGTPGFIKKVTSKIGKVKLSDKDFDVYGEELEMLLIENNVALEVAEKVVKELKQRVVNQNLLKKELEGEIKDALKEILKSTLVDPFLIIDKIKEKQEKPYTILFCGINGTGKTTTVAKIASQLKDAGISSVMAAGDTFRAASIEQIKIHGEKLGVKVIAGDYGVDPASVGFDAINYAKKNKIQCVLIDTAGRMHTSKNLLKEIEKISKVTSPDLKIFVGESITGNDAIEQVKSFDWAIGIDGIILTKADIDEKGGTALSVGYITKKPILYLGTGQEYDKIEPFDKQKFIEKLGLD